MADKTNVPGVNDFASVEDRGLSSDYYEKKDLSQAARKDIGAGTVITGETGEVEESVKIKTKRVEKDKPLLGFFYSVSRDKFGEYWPLYLGPNTIGRNSNSDIVLNEGTVSGNHATLIIHKEDDGEVYAGIKDNGSTYGVKVNGKSTHFDVVGCNNMDIIKVGKNYELLFILIDSDQVGLKPAENFVEVKQASSKQVDRRIITGPRSSGPATYRNPNSSRIANPSTNDRTRSMDGETEDIHNGTVTR